MKYNFKYDVFEITINGKDIQITPTDVLIAVNEYLRNHSNEIGVEEDFLHIATIKREVIELDRWDNNEVKNCYGCLSCNRIGNDEVLICCNKKSEMYNKEISKFGTCEFYKKQFLGDDTNG